MHDAAVVAGGAGGLDRSRVADRRVGPANHFLLGVLGLAPWQGLSLRAAVRVRLGVIGELPLAKEWCAVVEIGQREERPDAGVFEDDDVLGRAVGGVAGHLVRPERAPEA